ncbi:ComEA family DNA-binding protein [Agromyces tardus]|uniref:ComEA family DNA-binding protein n=1 Tax=Agromyces tardus TaxID=2583849 RepID=A0A3M8AI43_9MICO|nr:ComEA family DNA-binding protein [Agromyces tardus]RNB50828.1 ComEA family DNA-binding protein [Agromyces tardus]
MPEQPATDPLAVLDARARPRTRLAVGAAVTLFIVAVAVAAVLSFLGSGGGAQGVVSPGAPGVGLDHGAAGGSPSAGAEGSGGAGAAIDGAPSLLVHVLGAVAKPGLVELAPGSRVVDAVAAAGGFTTEADPAGVNLARPVVDGEQLVVRAVGEVAPPATASGGGGGGAAGDGKVHLNSADLAELDTLPRIGPALAQRIIDWREANGSFTSVDQLLDVAGIGDAVYSGIVDLVSL